MRQKEIQNRWANEPQKLFLSRVHQIFFSLYEVHMSQSLARFVQ